jgi:SAM-dependent methyltransferase
MATKLVNSTRTLPREMMGHTYAIFFEQEESHWWYVGRRRIIRSFVQEICEQIDKRDPQILDVGCGTGANLLMLSQLGEAEGVDISPQAIAFCQARGLSNVRLGAAEALPYDDNHFDLVTALDVVEHLDDDVGALREMRRVIRPGGRLLLFVPTFMFLWGLQDEVSNHRRRYRLAELRRAVVAAGFEIERSTYANITFFVPTLIVRQVMRLTGLSADSEVGINIKALNRLFAWIFGSEKRLLRVLNFPFGVSGICVARRAEERRLAD